MDEIMFFHIDIVLLKCIDIGRNFKLRPQRTIRKDDTFGIFYHRTLLENPSHFHLFRNVNCLLEKVSSILLITTRGWGGRWGNSQTSLC